MWHQLNNCQFVFQYQGLDQGRDSLHVEVLDHHSSWIGCEFPVRMLENMLHSFPIVPMTHPLQINSPISYHPFGGQGGTAFLLFSLIFFFSFLAGVQFRSIWINLGKMKKICKEMAEKLGLKLSPLNFLKVNDRAGALTAHFAR